MFEKRKTPIREVLRWSENCREHYFLWRSVSAGTELLEYIEEAGITEAHPGYELGRLQPRSNLLVYTMRGKGRVYTEDRSFTVERGQRLTVPARLNFGYVPAEEPWNFLWFHLPDSKHWAVLKRQGLSVRKTPLVDTLENLAGHFMTESQGRSDAHREAAQLYARLFLSYLRRENSPHAKSPATGISGKFDQLQKIINAQLSHPWTVQLLAKEMQVSAPHLYDLTREYLGTSPMKLVTRLRMDHAQELLVMGHSSVAEIANQVGYQDEFAFSVAFRRHSGVPPGRYRNFR